MQFVKRYDLFPAGNGLIFRRFADAGAAFFFPSSFHYHSAVIKGEQRFEGYIFIKLYADTVAYAALERRFRYAAGAYCVSGYRLFAP